MGMHSSILSQQHTRGNINNKKIIHLALLFLLLLTVFTNSKNHLPIVRRIDAAMSSSSTSTNVKRILVTGGNKGIGKAICEKLLTEWTDTHVLLAARDAVKGQEAVRDLVRIVGGNCQDRVELVVLDTSSDVSVLAAAEANKDQLYGIINNAGIGWGNTMTDNVNTNYFGPRRVNEAFGPFLQRPGGRIVNVASASGPNYVSSLPETSSHKSLLGQPWTIPGGVAELDVMARSMSGEAYGASKALLNAYTVLHAKVEPDLIINSVTPGFIQTDMTSGTSATNLPSKGAVPPCWLMMDTETVPNLPRGRYYGSDCVRSPLDTYRGPGEPPFESNTDVVDLPESARAIPTVF